MLLPLALSLGLQLVLATCVPIGGVPKYGTLFLNANEVRELAKAMPQCSGFFRGTKTLPVRKVENTVKGCRDLDQGNTVLVGMFFISPSRRHRVAYPEIVSSAGEVDLWNEYSGSRPSVAKVTEEERGECCLVTFTPPASAQPANPQGGPDDKSGSLAWLMASGSTLKTLGRA